MIVYVIILYLTHFLVPKKLCQKLMIGFPKSYL